MFISFNAKSNSSETQKYGIYFLTLYRIKKKQTQHRVEGFGANKEKRTTNSKETRAGVAVNSKKSQPQAKLHLGHVPFLL